MDNVFRKLFKDDKTVSSAKKDLHKKITNKAWEISKKVPFGKLLKSDVTELEKLYEQYFTLYPDKKAQLNSADRIKKLKTFMK